MWYLGVRAINSVSQIHASVKCSSGVYSGVVFGTSAMPVCHRFIQVSGRDIAVLVYTGKSNMSTPRVVKHKGSYGICNKATSMVHSIGLTNQGWHQTICQVG